MRKTINLIPLLLAVFLFASAEQTAESILHQFQLDGTQAIVFAAELDISNGSPFTRDFGERGMFGRLVLGERVAKTEEYASVSEEIFREAKRLLLGPWINGGGSELSLVIVGRGLQLDLNTGKWVRSKGGQAILVKHTTEYMNKKRNAHILLDGMTLWRKGD